MKNNKINEYRENLAKTFLSVLEEKQLDWKKGWTAEKPQNAETGYKYKGNQFYVFEIDCQGEKDMKIIVGLHSCK